MEQDVGRIRQAIDGPPPTHTRNINIDTHLGHAPQRPYAVLEDMMATITSGYRDVAQLRAALEGQPEAVGAPDGAPNANDVQEENGALFRYVPDGNSRDISVVEGVISETIRYVRRAVSLSQEGARIGAENGVGTDYFNGFTWLRDGFKAEKDFPVMMAQRAAAAEQPMVFTMPVSPTTAAAVRHEVARMDVNRPPLPVENRGEQSRRPEPRQQPEHRQAPARKDD